MPASAYIHIPFCKKKCHYCSFVSFEDFSLCEEYVEKLVEEIRYYYKGESLSTIYFGGGTPSLLDLSDFKKILGCFNFDRSTEITVEVNPDSTSFEFLKGLKELGVNRLSIGMQSFNDKMLKEIGRLHNSKSATESFQNARKAGFENISLDLIYGLPGQSLKNFDDDFKKAIRLEPEHISLYGLKIEEGTKLYEKTKKKPATLPDEANEELQAKMYLHTIDIMKEKGPTNGFLHYEISNFAREDYHSKHNLNYWNNEEYYGFGTAAHGYAGGVRYSNLCNLHGYLKTPIKKQDEHTVTFKEKLEEEIFLGFRRCSGINIQEINEKFSIDFNEKYKDIIKKFLDSGHLEETETGYRLTTDGILLSNNVLSEFL